MWDIIIEPMGVFGAIRRGAKKAASLGRRAARSKHGKKAVAYGKSQMAHIGKELVAAGKEYASTEGKRVAGEVLTSVKNGEGKAGAMSHIKKEGHRVKGHVKKNGAGHLVAAAKRGHRAQY